MDGAEDTHHEAEHTRSGVIPQSVGSALIALRDVRVHFPVGGRVLRALAGVSLDIDEGETVALVGESGSGKSTLGNVVAGLQIPTAGDIRFRGQPLAAARGAARAAIQIVFQDPFGALDPRMPVSALITEPLRIQRLGTPAERRLRAAELVELVGLPRDALNRYPHEFSGGQRQRIAIARALAPRPALIVADEPLSALDVSIQSQILNLLRTLQRGSGVAYLFISHDMGAVSHLADRVAVLYLGRIVEMASRDELFATPSHPYTQALLNAVPRIGQRRVKGRAIAGEIPSPFSPPPGCVFHPRCPIASDRCRIETPLLRPAPGRATQLAACHHKV